MEKVKGDVVSIDFIEKEIDRLIDDFCTKYDVEDMRKASQNEWYACMIYIYRNFFKGSNILKDNIINNSNGIMNTNNNRYNIDLLSNVLDYYIYLCDMNCKVSNITGFCNLTGINEDTIYDWGQGRNKGATCKTVDFMQKLSRSSESSAAAKALSGDGNKVGVLAYLNHYHQWNMPGVTRETVQRTSLTAAELPKLSSNPQQLEEK